MGEDDLRHMDPFSEEPGEPERRHGHGQRGDDARQRDEARTLRALAIDANNSVEQVSTGPHVSTTSLEGMGEVFMERPVVTVDVFWRAVFETRGADGNLVQRVTVDRLLTSSTIQLPDPPPLD